MNAAEKMHTLLASLDHGFNGMDIDSMPDAPEDWTRSFACAVLEVVEPNDDVRRYFDLDAYMDDLTRRVADHFGAREKKPKVRLVIGSKKSNAKPSEWILHIRRKNFWGLSVECYRKPKERSK